MASVVDLVGILDDLKALLGGANTVGALPIYLSNNMQSQVNYIGTVHPIQIPLQASLYPFVTCYVTNKKIESTGMAINQSNAKKKTVINVDIVGAVHNSINTDFTKDISARDCMYLMENIELILRGSDTINDKVKWQSASETNYYDSVSNDGYIRAGILSLKGTTVY